MKGKIQTVLGSIDPSELGITLTHEHLFSNATPLAANQLEKNFINHLPFSLKNIGLIQQYPYSNNDNLIFNSPEIASVMPEEVTMFKTAGGGTIVENSICGLSRNATFLKNLSKKTGVNIVAGTGYYVNGAQTATSLRLSEEEMTAVILNDFLDGCEEEKSVKCGILGEIGTSWPITDFEKRSLRASGSVSEQLGCPAMIHPGRDSKCPSEAVRIFAEAGGDVKKLVMGHLDRSLHTHEDMVEFASLGTYLEYDLFGIEKSFYQLNSSIDMPSDAQRIARIKYYIEQGYLDRMLVAHDIHTKHRLVNFGGHGYAHILNIIVPMMLERGITQDQVNAILVSNPASWLVFSK